VCMCVCVYVCMCVCVYVCMCVYVRVMLCFSCRLSVCPICMILYHGPPHFKGEHHILLNLRPRQNFLRKRGGPDNSKLIVWGRIKIFVGMGPSLWARRLFDDLNVFHMSVEVVVIL
jgi:hypothetical protein